MISSLSTLVVVSDSMLEAASEHHFHHLLSIYFGAFDNSFAAEILKTPTIGEIKSIFGE